MKPVGRKRRKLPGEAPGHAGWTEAEREARLAEIRLETPLTEVSGLTVRAINTLEAEGILYVKDLVAKKAAELLKLANFGEKTLVELREVLKTFGVKTAWKLPPKRKRKKKQ